MNRAFRNVHLAKSSVAQMLPSSKVMSASEIRKTFIDYFCEHNDHLHIRSSPVFSLKDPTLAFTNAGMNQFKEVFLGLIEPASKKVANSQKCIRIGGMHNDLSQVGEDGTHHTFFEMLGNWSFGDYFKEKACRYSWDLLTKVFNIPPERLYVTYFKGDSKLGLKEDCDVKVIWQNIGVEESHLLGFGSEHNFWAGSLTGPCGPCTEIHYVHSPERTDVGSLVNSGRSEVTELWNLVFIQYDRKSNGTLKKLNTHFVDTGMGFERLVAVLQGKLSNYDTDLFLPLFDVIKKHTGHSGYTGQYNNSPMDNSYRTLADHSRMIAVALSDGMIPNHQNKVRGIIKRTLRIVENSFNATPDLLKELTVHVAQSLLDVYPEVGRNLTKIHYIIEEEAHLLKSKQKIATRRWNNLKKLYPALHDLDIKEIPQIVEGLNYINKIISQGKKTLSSEDIFVLFETYGIPVNQTKEIAFKLDLNVDMLAYEKYEASVKETEKKKVLNKFLSAFNEYSYLEILSQLQEKNIQPTLDYFKYNYIANKDGKYTFEIMPITVQAILFKNKLVDEILPKDVEGEEESIGLILDRTHFFSKDGGQQSDFGSLKLKNHIHFDIDNVIKVKNYVIHFGHFVSFPSTSKLAVQNFGTLELNEDRRLSLMRNHTALHLLNAALREELYVTGEKYSEITPEKLTLSFMIYRNNLNGIEGLKKIEKFVKDVILHGVSVNRKIFNHQEFRSINDVVYVPGEPVLKREIPVIEINSGFKLSKEYCTGTHVLNTSHLQDFIITKLVKGSYNLSYIEAVTGEMCSLIKKNDSIYKEILSALEKKISDFIPPNNPEEVHNLDGECKKLFKNINDSTEVSQITKFEINEKVKGVEENLATLMQTAVRNYLTEKIREGSTSENFIVLFLKCCWKFNPTHLEEVAASVCNNKPILIVFQKEKSISVQCVVPKEFVSERFSARKWLRDSMNSLDGIGSCEKHQNPDLIFFVSDMEHNILQVNHILDAGIKIAKDNFTFK